MTVTVERIEHGHGSHIVPPLDSSWSQLDQLRWKAAVATLDSGLTVEVAPTSEAGQFYIRVGPGSHTPFDFTDAWTYLNGVVVGACEARRTG